MDLSCTFAISGKLRRQHAATHGFSNRERSDKITKSGERLVLALVP
jgi:hypothetical protein